MLILNLGCGTRTAAHPDVLNVDWSLNIRIKNSRLLRFVASPLLDEHTQGGAAYAYKLRAIAHDVEGPASECIDLVSEDNCTLHPTIANASLAGQGWNDICAVNLRWQASAPTCAGALPEDITYRLERSTDAFMAGATTVATGLVDTNYTDTSVTNGTAYFYRFQAIDGLGNVSDLSDIATTMAAGPAGPDPTLFSDNADGVAWLEQEPGWAISALAAADGQYSYHTGGQAPVYGDMTCASIETPTLDLPTHNINSDGTKSPGPMDGRPYDRVSPLGHGREAQGRTRVIDMEDAGSALFQASECGRRWTRPITAS